MVNIPNDDTGNAIKEIISNGVNLEKTMDIDFFLTIPNEEIGNNIADEINKNGFNTSIEYDDEYDEWTCYCNKNMLLDYTSIVEIENYLAKIAKKYGASLDGFGSYGNL